MQTIKVMGIIGVAFFVLCFFVIGESIAEDDLYGAMAVSLFSVLYGLAMAIVFLVTANRVINKRTNINQ